MANFFTYQEKQFKIGDTIKISYKILEGEKSRIQDFAGILISVKGNNEQNRMITLRKISRSGIGVERIIPLASPFISAIKLLKKSNYQKSKAYFIRDLSLRKLRKKLYREKS